MHVYMQVYVIILSWESCFMKVINIYITIYFYKDIIYYSYVATC